MITGMVFDCDGTILDSMGAWTMTQTRLADAAGIRLTKQDTDTICTLTIPEVGTYFHQQYGLGTSDAAVTNMIDDMMLDYYRYRVVARPGAVQLIHDLVHMGARCSIASSSPQRYLRAGLERVDLWGLFSTVLSVDDVGTSKREPEIYCRAMQEMGTTADQSWGVDDSLYAVREMNLCGMRTVGIYDRDESATFDDLQKTATVATRSLDQLDVTAFFEPKPEN